MSWIQKLCVSMLTVLVAFAIVAYNRHTVMVYVLELAQGEPPPLGDADTESADTRWFDDYYTIAEIAHDTWAIGEPRYYQQNFNYLVVGTERAVLFDAGPGVRSIQPVIRSLTDLPIVFLPSHFHYDHVGNGVNFSERAVI